MQGNLYTSSSKIFNKTKAVAFVGLLLCVILLIGNAYETASKKNKINMWSKQRFVDFYNSDKNSIDMLFIGSSHSYCTFDPLVVDEKLLLNTYQLGMPEQYPDTSYYTLLEALNYQKPKKVVMEIFFGVMDKDFNYKQADLLFQVMENNKLRLDYVKNVFPANEKAKYLIPAIRFQTDFIQWANNALTKIINDKFKLRKNRETENKVIAGEEYYRSKGFIYCDYVMSEEEQKKVGGFNGEKWNISNVQKKYLEKIMELCKQNDIELIWVTAPISYAALEKTVSYNKIHNTIKAIADENNICYLDFNTLYPNIKIFEDDDFRDASHLNYNGAVIASEYFSNWLEQN